MNKACAPFLLKREGELISCARSSCWILCLATRDTRTKSPYQLYHFSGVAGRVGGLSALSGQQDGIRFQPCSFKHIHFFPPLSRKAPFDAGCSGTDWSWGLFEKGSSCSHCLNPPPTPVSSRGGERGRQTAPQQPTHTKLILTRNLR